MKRKKQNIDIYYQELLDTIQNNTEVDWQKESILKALKTYLAALSCYFDSVANESYSIQKILLQQKEVI